MSRKCLAVLSVVIMVVGLCVRAETVGFREITGVHVGSGTQTLSGGVAISQKGELVKTGAGTLEVPMSGIKGVAPYNITVAGGKLALTGAKGTPSAEAPAFVAEKAEFWVDASELTDGDPVTTWNDKRSGAAWSAVVQYRNAPEETPPDTRPRHGRTTSPTRRTPRWPLTCRQVCVSQRPPMAALPPSRRATANCAWARSQKTSSG